MKLFLSNRNRERLRRARLAGGIAAVLLLTAISRIGLGNLAAG